MAVAPAVCMLMYVCAFECTYLCVCACVHVCMFVCVYTSVSENVLHICVCTCTFLHACMHACMFCMHTRMIHTIYMYTYIHIHTLKTKRTFIDTSSPSKPHETSPQFSNYHVQMLSLCDHSPVIDPGRSGCLALPNLPSRSASES